MARALRLEYPGALYHVTARGDRREDIFFREEDRADFLSVLGEVCHRFNWVVHAYCQMTNHYHLLVETVDGHLGRGMRQLNGVYTQRVNCVAMAWLGICSRGVTKPSWCRKRPICSSWPGMSY